MLDTGLDLKRLEDSIAGFDKEEIREGGILFYGSSFYTRWSERYGNIPMEEALKNDHYPIINHGFGSATSEEMLYYYPRAVKPWKPKVLVTSISGNDIGFGYTVHEIFFLFERLLEYARTDNPGVHIYVAQMTPSLKHRDDKKGYYTTHRDRISRMIAEYCAKNDDCTLLDYVNDAPMFFEKPEDLGHFERCRSDIFLEDGIHINAKGYALFREYYRSKITEIGG